jgi:hypothetical protein
MFHPNYLCNISQYFMLSEFFLIPNTVLISIHRCLDLTYIDCLAVIHGAFNFLYKEIMNPIIFIIHMLRLSYTFCRYFFSQYHKIL